MKGKAFLLVSSLTQHHDGLQHPAFANHVVFSSSSGTLATGLSCTVGRLFFAVVLPVAPPLPASCTPTCSAVVNVTSRAIFPSLRRCIQHSAEGGLTKIHRSATSCATRYYAFPRSHRWRWPVQKIRFRSPGF
ncbi:hypothetical protein KCP77_08420 [Salmonella enterica subsp. enterica]|nr:hypothetical protein KCP77_08420 [Salmonella enterica subsp. enterica]